MEEFLKSINLDKLNRQQTISLHGFMCRIMYRLSNEIEEKIDALKWNSNCPISKEEFEKAVLKMKEDAKLVKIRGIVENSKNLNFDEMPKEGISVLLKEAIHLSLSLNYGLEGFRRAGR